MESQMLVSRLIQRKPNANRHLSLLLGAAEHCTSAISTSEQRAHWGNNRLNEVRTDFRPCTHHAWVYGKHGPGETLTCATERCEAALKSAGRVVHCDAEVDVGTAAEDGEVVETVKALETLVDRGSYVSLRFFYEAVRKCTADKVLVHGSRVHAVSVRSGYQSNTFLANNIIRMYAAHKKLQEATEVFAHHGAPNSYMWFSIISAHVELGQGAQAIQLYARMRQSSTEPNDYVFVAVLKACATEADITSGKQVHADVLQSAVEDNVFVGNGIVDMYAKCGSLDDARRVFDCLTTKDVVSWNTMISGYVQHGQVESCLSLHSHMCQEDVTASDNVTFLCILKACASIGALRQGSKLHALLLERDAMADIAIANCLVDMYVKSDSLRNARKVFDALPIKNVVTWTTMITGYTQHGLSSEGLDLFARMQQVGMTPDPVIFCCLLKSCSTSKALYAGKQLHCQIQEQGLDIDVLLSNSLVDMYAKCGSLNDARMVFDTLATKDIVTWTAMIAGYAEHGFGREALALYAQMQSECTTPADNVMFASLLKSCASVGDLCQGMQLHSQIQNQGLETDAVICNSLVNMYSSCGSLGDARYVFDGMQTKDVVSWTAMISAYSEHGLPQESLTLYVMMQKDGMIPANHVTFVCLLKACASIGALREGEEIHSDIRKRGLGDDVVIGNCLVDMYAKCGCLDKARSVFDSLSTKDVVTWNAMLAGYAHHGLGEDCLSLYACMEQDGIILADVVTFVCLLKTCVVLGSLHYGMRLHADIQDQGLEDDLVLGSSLVDMYAKCQSLENARRVFNKLTKKDVVAWTAIIDGYAQHGCGQESLSLYASMQQKGIVTADDVLLSCLLKACASVGDLHQGRQIHSQIQGKGLEHDVVIGNSLVDMYAKCGSLADARMVFDRLPARDVVTWTAMIVGYAEQGLSQEAISMYSKMQEEGLTPVDHPTFACLLRACAGVGALQQGEHLHSQVQDRGFETELFPVLVDMYTKCGSLEDACKVFRKLPAKDVVTWNAMISGYSQHGLGQEALQCYDEMRLAGFEPNGVTFLSLLSACSHAGLVEKGIEYFESMRTEHGITPEVEHYVCMVDLFGRAGSFNSIQRLLSTMPMEPGLSLWLCLLGACRKHGNVPLGENAFTHAVHLQPKHSAAYVLMAQIYAGAGLLDHAWEVHSLRRKQGAWKNPGLSWIEHDHRVHIFVVGDCQSPRHKKLTDLLRRLGSQQEELRPL